MGYGANYAGIQLENYINIWKINRDILPTRKNYTKDIPSLNGEVYMGYKYAPRPIGLECSVNASSREEYIDILKQLAFIFDVKTPKKLILSDDKTRYCYAVLDGGVSEEKIKYGAKFELKFICYDPYLYSIENDTFSGVKARIGKSIPVSNGGSTDTYPKISVSFNNTAHFLQCTDDLGRTVLIGQPPNVDNAQGKFNPIVLKDNCELLTDWNPTGNILDDGRLVEGDLRINAGGYGITCGNFGSSDAGWHGGARRRNLNAKVESFEVKVKMEYNSLGDLRGAGGGTIPPVTSGGVSVKYQCTAEVSLWVRTGRGTSNDKLGYLKHGDIVDVTDIQQNWGKITFKNQTGYISMSYMREYKPSAESGGGVYIINATPSLRIRSGRGTNHKQIGSIPNKETVTVYEVQSGWGKTTYNGHTGYIAMQYAIKQSGTSMGLMTTGAEETPSAEERMGRMEVYGYDSNGTKLWKMSMVDNSEYYEYTQPEIEIGSTLVLDDNKACPAPKTVTEQDEKDKNKTVTKQTDSGAFGDWNNFVGWFTIRRRRNEKGQLQWWCKIDKIDDSGKVIRSIQTNTLINDSYPKGELSNIVIWIGQYKKSIAVDVMNVNEVYVTDIGEPPKPKENKPLFKKGDELIIDFASQDVNTWLGSEMQNLDIGSEFFEVPVGASTIYINSDDKELDVVASLQKRWL